MGWLLKLVTGNPLILLWIVGSAFAAGLASGGSGAWWLQGLRLDSAKAETKTVQADFKVFKTKVEGEGKLAHERAETQRKQDLQRAKEADDEAKKRYRSLDAQYAAYRLRQRAGNSATSRIVPAAPAGTPGGSSVCYSRDALNLEIAGEIGRLYAGIADDAQPYDSATVVARTCKEWAVGR